LLKLIIIDSLPEMISKKVFLKLKRLNEVYLDSEKLIEFHRKSGEYFEINLNGNSKYSKDFFYKLEKFSISLKIINSLNQKCFENFVHLQEINLNFCGLFFIAADCFADLNGLKILNLSNNQISKLHVNTFRNLINLEKLNLSWNKIVILKARLFQTLRNLKFLDLSFNSTLKLENNVLGNLINLEELHMPQFELIRNEKNSINSPFLFEKLNQLKQLNIQNTKNITDLNSNIFLEQLKLGK
jgi:hypothetical protein